MILNLQTKGYEARSDKPNENWTDDESLVVIPDGSELAQKIIANYPNFDIVLTDCVLTDVTPTDPPIDYTAQINALKAQLTATDYKVIKCYEYSLAGLALPYDIAALHAERQAIRDQINALELEG